MGFSVEHVYKTMRVMRFAPELAGKVMDGSKTVSRRRSSYEPGSLCAIECEGERLGTLAVTSVREERLGDVTSDDVALEGFDRASDFFNFWWSVFPEDSLGFCWLFMGFLVFAWFLCYNKKCLQYEIETIFYYFLLSLFLGVYCYGF